MTKQRWVPSFEVHPDRPEKFERSSPRLRYQQAYDALVEASRVGGSISYPSASARELCGRNELKRVFEAVRRVAERRNEGIVRTAFVNGRRHFWLEAK